MFTIADIVARPSLNVISGDSQLSRSVRWVHVSEHVDPAPWISGGELVLTTGYNLSDEERQRRFVDRLAECGVAGLGFGVGFEHEEVPAAVVEESEELGLPLIRVPYDMSFISIIEDASAALLEERNESLRRSQKIQTQLEKELIGGAGPERILQILSTETQGSACIIDESGQRTTSQGNFRWPEALADELLARVGARRVSDFTPESTGKASLAVPIPGRAGNTRPHWLVFVSSTDRAPGDFETQLAKGCATVCGLHRSTVDAVLQVQRHANQDVLQSAVDGDLTGRQVERRLDSLGLEGEITVLAVETRGPDVAVETLENGLKDTGTEAMVALARSGAECFACVLIKSGAGSTAGLAGELLESLRETDADARGGLSRPVAGRELARAFQEARCCVKSTRTSARPPTLATIADLGSLSLLFSLNDDGMLRAFSAAVLDPVGPENDDFTAELLSSLDTFIDCNGNWEKASRTLFCHRHTLRHRIKRVEELTGRDLSDARDRFDFWVALRARDVVGTAG